MAIVNLHNNEKFKGLAEALKKRNKALAEKNTALKEICELIEPHLYDQEHLLMTIYEKAKKALEI